MKLRRSAQFLTLFLVALVVACRPIMPELPVTEMVTPGATAEATAPAATGSTGQGVTDVQLPLTGANWTLVAFGDEEDVEYDPFATAVTALFGEDGMVAGTSGCNHYGGPYRLDGDTINFGPLVSTLMACPGPAMDVEAAYLRALESTGAYAVHGNLLEINYAEGQLVFRGEAGR